MNDDTKPNIYQRIAAVMKEVAYVQKDTEVSEGGRYKAVTHDMVTAVVRPSFVKHGIIIVPRVTSAQFVDTGRKSSKGNPAMRYEARFIVDFVNVDDPADRIPVEVDAHADDYGDKAPGKALSYAVKGAILKVLMLETGENDEGRIAPDVSLTEEQEEALQKLRESALEGTEALKAGWEAAGKFMRLDLASHLDGLRAAAKEADAATAAKAAAGGSK